MKVLFTYDFIAGAMRGTDDVGTHGWAFSCVRELVTRPLRTDTVRIFGERYGIDSITLLDAEAEDGALMHVDLQCASSIYNYQTDGLLPNEHLAITKMPRVIRERFDRMKAAGWKVVSST